VGEQVVVEADIFADGHEALAAVLLYRYEEEQWSQIALQAVGNDRWRGMFVVTRVGRYYYTLGAHIDRFTSWRRDLAKKVAAEQEIAIDLLTGAGLIAEASERAACEDARKLKEWADMLRQTGDSPLSAYTDLVLSEELEALVEKYPDQRFAAIYEKEL